VNRVQFAESAGQAMGGGLGGEMAIQTATIERVLITVDEYDHMIQAGIFNEDVRLELIEGELIKMSPIGSTHAGFINRLNRALSAQVGSQAIIAVQNPIRLANSEPQPDLAVLRTRADDYTRSHPEADDVLLLIEVADTSVDYDRTVKVPLYGRSGIPEVWLIDLFENVVEVYRTPAAAGYRSKQTYGTGDSLTPERLPAVTLPVADIFGKPPVLND
jgi:Uma2 family endonuclease